MVADGHAKQTRDKGGWVKAMAYVGPDGSIIRCYNCPTPVLHATGDCGISVDHRFTGAYFVDFGFNVADRFVSETAVVSGDLTNQNLTLFQDSVPATAWGFQSKTTLVTWIAAS